MNSLPHNKMKKAGAQSILGIRLGELRPQHEEPGRGRAEETERGGGHARAAQPSQHCPVSRGHTIRGTHQYICGMDGRYSS